MIKLKFEYFFRRYKRLLANLCIFVKKSKLCKYDNQINLFILPSSDEDNPCRLLETLGDVLLLEVLEAELPLRASLLLIDESVSKVI